MATEIIEEIEAGGDVYLLHSKAMKNSNNTNSNTPYVYDWIGTQQEYNDQNIASLHPEWVCYITDDVEGGVSVYTKIEIDNAVLHKAGSEEYTGRKTFTSTGENWGLVLKNPSAEQQTAATTYTEKLIGWFDRNNVRIGSIGTGIETDGKSRCYFGASKNINGTNIYSLVETKVDLNGNCMCGLPTNTYGTYFHGTADYAKWADLAEMYETDKTYTPGTLIKFGGRKDITIANNKCNGVISDKPGFVLDAGKENSLPVALVGKTPVKIIGKVKKFDPITLSETPGVGRVATEGEKVIGKALETSEDENEKLVMCVTKFNID